MAQTLLLAPATAQWLLERGFSLTDWSSIPIAADAVMDTFGEDARRQVIDHGRWLVRTLGKALLDEVRRALPRRQQSTLQQGICVDVRDGRLENLQSGLLMLRQAVDGALTESGRSALVQLVALLEAYLASPLALPSQIGRQRGSGQSGKRSSNCTEPVAPADGPSRSS